MESDGGNWRGSVVSINYICAGVLPSLGWFEANIGVGKCKFVRS